MYGKIQPTYLSTAEHHIIEQYTTGTKFKNSINLNF